MVAAEGNLWRGDLRANRFADLIPYALLHCLANNVRRIPYGSAHYADPRKQAWTAWWCFLGSEGFVSRRRCMVTKMYNIFQLADLKLAIVLCCRCGTLICGSISKWPLRRTQQMGPSKNNAPNQIETTTNCQMTFPNDSENVRVTILFFVAKFVPYVTR
jgi:hypothetical protein